MRANLTNRMRCTIAATLIAVTVPTIAAPPPEIDPRSKIRTNSVKNLCEMYRSTYTGLIKQRGTPGFQNQIILDTAASETDPAIREFTVGVAQKLVRTNSDRRAMNILNSDSKFTQPCYNALANSYDRSPSRFTTNRPEQENRTTERQQPRQTGTDSRASQTRNRNSSRSYSNNRR